MNQIVKHSMFGFHGEEPPVMEFQSIADLLEIPWVKQWLGSGDYRLSTSGNALMVEKGREFWCVGFLKEPIPDLPKWEAP